MANNLLAVVGPTATGKTALALKLAQKQPSILVSADSRQVYRGMDIVTGKDQPSGIEIFGLDLVAPDEPCSVAVWYDAVMPAIRQAWLAGKLPIIVGGTGLYVKALLEGIETMGVPPAPALRAELEPLSVSELQARLDSLSPARLTSMNESDRANPRRLIRAIEIASSPFSSRSKTPSPPAAILGLQYSDTSQYQSVVAARVRSRLASGALAETERLLHRYGDRLESLTAIGYRSLIRFLHGEIDEETMVASWVHDELAYAKRQMTWFKKQPVEWRYLDKPASI